MSTCKACGGDVAVVLNRAWCLKSYADNGCAGHWTRRSANAKWQANKDTERLAWVALMKSPKAIEWNAAYNSRHSR